MTKGGGGAVLANVSEAFSNGSVDSHNSTSVLGGFKHDLSTPAPRKDSLAPASARIAAGPISQAVLPFAETCNSKGEGKSNGNGNGNSNSKQARPDPNHVTPSPLPPSLSLNPLVLLSVTAVDKAKASIFDFEDCEEQSNLKGEELVELSDDDCGDCGSNISDENTHKNGRGGGENDIFSLSTLSPSRLFATLKKRKRYGRGPKLTESLLELHDQNQENSEECVRERKKAR